MAFSEKQTLESALRILGIKFDNSDNEDKLKILLSDAIKYPLSENEWEIYRTIKVLLNERGNTSKSKKALSHLEELVSYSQWD